MPRHTEDYGRNDAFDIVPPTQPPQSEFATNANSNILSADEVQAAVFDVSKPGYVFRQVEGFVDQVGATLKYLETRMYEDNVRIHDLNDEISNLQEKNLTLQATIEVLRVKGDVVARDDGSLITKSQVESTTAPSHEISELESRIGSLTAEREQLIKDLAEVKASEAELRRYLEEEMQPWVDAAIANQEAMQQALDVKDAQLAEARAGTGIAAQGDAELLQQLETSRSELMSVRALVSSLETRLSEAQDKMSASSERAEYAETMAADSQVKIATLEMDVERLSAELAQAQNPAPVEHKIPSWITATENPYVDESENVDAGSEKIEQPPTPRRARRLLDSPEAAAAEAEGIDVEIEDPFEEPDSAPEAGRPIPSVLSKSPEALALEDDEF